ncbi:unnamed protein product, partial [Strongylus vulgaris]
IPQPNISRVYRKQQIVSQHLTRHRGIRCHKQRFLYRVVREMRSGAYINMKQRKEWMAPGDTPMPKVKPDLHPKKIMIVWRDWGMLHWEMLERNTAVNKELHMAKLHCVEETPSKRSNHTPSRQRQAPYCIIRKTRTPRARMGGPLASTLLSGYCTHELPLLPLSAEPHEGRPAEFWRCSIDKLIEMWEEIVNSNGEYIIS